MAPSKIAWLPGDGMGREVREAARMVLEAMKYDAHCVWLVRRPLEVDLIVAEHMFGDILSDLVPGW